MVKGLGNNKVRLEKLKADFSGKKRQRSDLIDAHNTLTSDEKVHPNCFVTLARTCTAFLIFFSQLLSYYFSMVSLNWVYF